MKLLKWISFVVMIITLCICANIASAAPVISVEPMSIEVTQGEIFTVDIMIELSGGEEIYGAQYDLHFDNALLSGVDKCEKGTFLSHDGVSTTVYLNKINNTIGMVEYSETRTVVDYGVTASGILATIKFNATGSGVCGLTLDNVILSDSVPQEIPGVVVNDGTIKIVAAEHTPTATATSKPISPTPVETATAVQTDTDLVPPLPGPHITETQSTIPAQTQAHLSEENTPQSGFTSAIAIIGMLVVLYVILRKK